MARKTRPLLERAFNDLTGFVSARELHAHVVASGEHVGLATVYRELRRMLDAGVVDVLHDHDGEARYRWCAAAHHHHLVCGSCGTTEEIDGDVLERWIESVTTSAGFSDVRHVIELVGMCRACQ